MLLLRSSTSLPIYLCDQRSNSQGKLYMLGLQSKWRLCLLVVSTFEEADSSCQYHLSLHNRLYVMQTCCRLKGLNVIVVTCKLRLFPPTVSVDVGVFLSLTIFSSSLLLLPIKTPALPLLRIARSNHLCCRLRQMNTNICQNYDSKSEGSVTVTRTVTVLFPKGQVPVTIQYSTKNYNM